MHSLWHDLLLSGNMAPSSRCVAIEGGSDGSFNPGVDVLEPQGPSVNNETLANEQNSLGINFKSYPCKTGLPSVPQALSPTYSRWRASTSVLRHLCISGITPPPLKILTEKSVNLQSSHVE